MDIIKGINTCLENLHELVYSFEEMKEEANIDLSSIPENLERLQQIKNFLDQVENLVPETEPVSEEPTPIVPIEEPVPTPLADETNENAVPIANTIAKAIYPDLKKSLSLVDRFRFAKELFANDMNRLDETLGKLNEMQSLDEAIHFLDTEFAWDWNNEPAADFKEMLTNRFS